MRSFLFVLFFAAGLLPLAVSASSAGQPQWALASASEITAATDGHQVTTAAVIELKMCYEAQLQPNRTKFSYNVVVARVPGTEQKVCGLSIRKAVVSISEAGSPNSVTVKTSDGSSQYPVSTAGAIVTF